MQPEKLFSGENSDNGAGFRYADGGYSELKLHSMFHTATEANADLLQVIEIFYRWEAVY
jgi:hypothetical protein